MKTTSIARSALPRLRIGFNRILFRTMLFSMGLVAVVLYPLVRDKSQVWRFAKGQARNLVRACGVRVRIRGLEKLGAGPYIFTPNHKSHFDIAALLGYLPGSNRFAAKKELFSEPVLGLVLRTLGMIPVDRNDPQATVVALRRVGRSNASMIIFPEGTRNAGEGLLEFKKGAFVAAIELGFPVVPVVCKGTAEVMPKRGYLSIRPGDVEITVLDPIDTRAMTYEDRDRLRTVVCEKIRAELAIPMVRDPN